MKTPGLKIKAAVWICLPLVMLAVPFVQLTLMARTVSVFAAVYFVMMGVWFGARFARASVPLRVIFILGGANAAVFVITFLGAWAAAFDVTWLIYKLYGGLLYGIGSEITDVFMQSVSPFYDWVFLLGGHASFLLMALLGVVLMVIFFLLGFLFARGYLYGRRVGDEH